MKLLGQIPVSLTNVVICAVVGTAVWVTKDGTALLGLAFLQPAQATVVPEASDMQNSVEEEGNPIGFVHS